MSRQKTPDQRPHLRNLYRCQWSSLPAYGQPHRAPTQTYAFSFLSFLSKEVFYTSYANWTRKSNNSPLLPLKRGGNNLKYHNQRHECSIRTICFSKCRSPMYFCQSFHESLSSVTEATQEQRGCAYPPRKKPFPIPSVRSAAGSLAWSVDIQHSWMWGV